MYISYLRHFSASAAGDLLLSIMDVGNFINTFKRNGMKKRYSAPVAESISIETYIIAASTGSAGAKTVHDVNDGIESGSWDDIWE